MSYLKRKLNNDIGLIFFRIAIFLFLAAASLAVYMIWHYLSYGQFTVDLAMQGFMQNIRTPWLTSVFRGITATGEPVPVILAALAVAILLVLRQMRREALLTALYMLGVWGANEFLKALIQRPRPDISLQLAKASGYSLPSGHSMNFMALVLLCLYFIWIFSGNKKLNIWATVSFITYGLLIGISRIYLNVHYFSDVITGWSIGAAWAAMGVIIHRLICIRQNTIRY